MFGWESLFAILDVSTGQVHACLLFSSSHLSIVSGAIVVVLLTDMVYTDSGGSLRLMGNRLLIWMPLLM